MRSPKDRRKPERGSTIPLEDISSAAPERRKQRDRRMENMSAEERQLLLSEMPGLNTEKPPRKD